MIDGGEVRARVLVAGWFSFDTGHATAGDLLACDLICDWVRAVGSAVDVAAAPPFAGEVDWRTIDPAAYTHVVFVCGPFEYRENEREFLARFSAARLIGVDLTMLVPLDVWQPFDLLLERDSTVAVRPDVVFASTEPLVPVVGVCLVEPYPAGHTAAVEQAVRGLLASRALAAVPIDTRLDHNRTGLRTSGEIESVLARMDVVVTSRLHGMVLALKHGVPALVIDPEAGGAKLRRQAQMIGWPFCFDVDALDADALEQAFTQCLTAEARALARRCAAATIPAIEHVRDELQRALAPGPPAPSARVQTAAVTRYRPADDAPDPAGETPRRWDPWRLLGRPRRGGAGV